MITFSEPSWKVIIIDKRNLGWWNTKTVCHAPVWECGNEFPIPDIVCIIVQRRRWQRPKRISYL